MEVVEAPPVPPVRPKPKRLRYLVAGGLCAAAVLFLVVGGLSKNIVYFRTTSEAVKTSVWRPRPSTPTDTSALFAPGK